MSEQFEPFQIKQVKVDDFPTFRELIKFRDNTIWSIFGVDELVELIEKERERINVNPYGPEPYITNGIKKMIKDSDEGKKGEWNDCR